MGKEVKKPNFFIVGAPKCGTTAMNEYLKQHPEIFIPDVKEVHYFGSDLQFSITGWERPRREDYLRLFEKAQNHKAIGETSVWYLYSETAAREIKLFSTAARVIIMLRNPIDMIYSLHSQYVYEGNEDIADFGAALDAEEKRKLGALVPAHTYLIKSLFYREVARYSNQVQRYIEIMGRENILVIIYDDFKENAAGEYKKALRFLNVDDNFEIDMNVVNPNKVVRSRHLQQTLMNPPKSLMRLGRYLKIPLKMQSLALEKLRAFNTRYETRRSMEMELRHALKREFRDDVQRLSLLLGRDVSFWTNS